MAWARSFLGHLIRPQKNSTKHTSPSPRWSFSPIPSSPGNSFHPAMSAYADLALRWRTKCPSLSYRWKSYCIPLPRIEQSILHYTNSRPFFFRSRKRKQNPPYASGRECWQSSAADFRPNQDTSKHPTSCTMVQIMIPAWTDPVGAKVWLDRWGSFSSHRFLSLASFHHVGERLAPWSNCYTLIPFTGFFVAGIMDQRKRRRAASQQFLCAIAAHCMRHVDSMHHWLHMTTNSSR